MKALLSLFILLSFLKQPKKSRLDLLCHKWIAVGGNDHGHEPKFSKAFDLHPMRIWFRKDGTFANEQNNAHFITLILIVVVFIQTFIILGKTNSKIVPHSSGFIIQMY